MPSFEARSKVMLKKYLPILRSAPRDRNPRRGSSFVEAAFVFVPLMAMIVAIFDYSMVILTRSTLQHAVREGVRYAITYQTNGNLPSGHDASIRAVVRNNSLGFLSSVNGTENPCRICIRYYDPDTLTFVTANSPGNVVEIAVENYTWNWIAPLMRSATPLTILVRASDRMESLPGGVAPPSR